MNAKSRKKSNAPDTDTLRPEYRREDLGPGIRGKYIAMGSVADATQTVVQPKPRKKQRER